MFSGILTEDDDDDDDDDDDAAEFRTARNDLNSCSSSLNSLHIASKFDRRSMSADGCDVRPTAIPLTVVGIGCDCGNGGDKWSCLASSSSELHIMYTVRRRFCRGKKEVG